MTTSTAIIRVLRCGSGPGP